MVDFTDVLDSVYSNVRINLSSGSALSSSTPSFSADSSTHSSLSGLFTILMKRDHYLLDSEGNTPSEGMQQVRRDVSPVNSALLPAQLELSLLKVSLALMGPEELPVTT